MSSYKDAGVDIEAGDRWVDALSARLGQGHSPDLLSKVKSRSGAYASVFASSEHQWTALACDGVGTKILWSKKGFGQPEAIAQDLLAMNANDLICVGATPLLFLDYLAISSSSMLQKGELLERFMGGLNQAAIDSGMMVVGGETAEMPDLYGPGDFDLAGFACGFLKPEDFLDTNDIQPGDELWGWASDGPHANGFSWLRKIFDEKKDAEWIDQLMKPTRLYVKDFLALRQELAQKGPTEKPIKAAYHITGSGLLNLLRCQPEGRQLGWDLDWPPWPQWLRAVADKSEASHEELYRSFNCGIGFAVVLDPKLARSQEPLLKSKGLRCLGRATASAELRVEDLRLKARRE